MSKSIQILKIATRTPPPVERKGFGPRQMSDLQKHIRALNVGECLEYRGDLKQATISGHVSNARTATGSQYTVRKVEGGCDIYRIPDEKAREA